MTGRTMTARRPLAKWLITLLPATVLTLVACGSTNPVAEPAASPPAGTPQPSVSQAGAETPQAALERWVIQILEERYVEACLSSAPVMPTGQNAATECEDPKVIKSAKSLREAWAKPGVKLPPQGKVEVTAAAAKGDKITVPDTAVKLDGRTLRSLELIGSSGDTDSFSLTFTLQKHNGAWYVQGFELNV